MSLILEALKKSEAERRLGRAPDLLTPAARAPAARSGWRGGLMLALLLAAAALGAGWWLGRDSAPVAASDGASAGRSESAAVVSGATGESEGADAAETPAPPARPAARRRVPEAAAPALPPLPREPEFAVNERESAPRAAGRFPDEPALAPRSEDAPASAVARRPAVAPAASSAAVSAPASAPAPAPAPLEALPHLGWLPAAEREGLPALRLSMHVYDSDPGARFALIDGHRLRQGEAVVEGLTVEEIRPDGVVLSRRGQRFLLPRP